MRTLPFGILYAAVCLLCLAGCPLTSSTTSPYAGSGGNGNNTGGVSIGEEVGKSTSRSVGSSGGTVSSAGYGASVVVPAGALQSSVTVTVTAADASTFPQADQVLSHVYDFGPSGTQFGSPTQVSLSIIGDLPDNTRAVLAFLNDDNAWQVVPNSTVNTSTKTVHGQVQHFTHFAILAIPTDGSGCADSPDPNAYCSPQTCDPNAGVCVGAVPGATYPVGGTITGLGKTSIALLLNGKAGTFSGDGNFTFATRLASGTNYNVTLPQQPNNRLCILANAGGTVSDAAIVDIAVTCTPTLALNGTVTGLDPNGPLVLQNGNQTVALKKGANTFVLARVVSGDDYDVAITAAPPDQNCTIDAPSGTADANDIALSVVCTYVRFALGGKVAGLIAKTQVTLTNADDVISPTNGNYVFPSHVAGGDTYRVGITAPPGQACAISGSTLASDTMPNATLTSVNVACHTLSYQVGGAVSGLSANTNVVLASGNDTLLVPNGNYAFPTAVVYSARYSVALTQPPYQHCAFSPANSNVGIMGAGDVNNVGVLCTQISYPLGGSVSGLATHSNVTLANNNDVISVTNGNYTFPTHLIYGAKYNVHITSPDGQTCVFGGNVIGNGNMPGAALGSISIACTQRTYTIGGTVTGLSTSGNITLQNGNETLSLYNGAYTFANPLPYAGNYNLILRAPPGMICGLGINSNGIMAAANITNASVTCSPNSFSLGGRVTGLLNNASVTVKNGSDAISVANSNYTLPSKIAFNSNYNVTLVSPAGQSCALTTTPNNTMGVANVTNMNIVCSPLTYTLSGTVAGLSFSANVALTSGSDTVSAPNGNFTFPTAIAYNSAYQVAISSPSYQTCVFSPANSNVGVMGSGNVTSVRVVCTPNTYPLGGRVSGLVNNTSVTLGNGHDTLTATNGNYVFPSQLIYGTGYDILITSPTGQSCAFANGVSGTGNMPGAALTGINVACAPRGYTIGGTVTGLTTSGNITLQNGTETLSLFNGTYVFANSVPYGGNYNLILSAPPGMICGLSINHNGVMSASNISVANVTCSPNSYGISGAVTGLVGSANVIVQNGGDTLSVPNGSYTLPTAVPFGSNYNVTLSSPAGQSCTFTRANGGTMGTAKVSNMNITCSPRSYALGGTVSGLSFSATVALTSGSDTLSVANGSYTFPSSIVYNANYRVAATAPSYQTCAFSPANSNVGVMGAGNVTNVKVVCTANTYPLGGHITGLVANTNVVLVNNSDSVSASNGSYVFPTQLTYSAAYDVIITSPAGQTCAYGTNVVGNGSMPGAALTNIDIACTPLTYTIAGRVTGLTTSGNLTLQNGSESLSLYNGAYAFATPVTYAGNYNLLLSAPPGMICGLNINHNGVMPAANITYANVTCSPNSYSLSGTITGLLNSAKVTVKNGSDSLSVTNGSYTLPTKVAFGSDYNVTLISPAGQSCTFTGTSKATMGTANLTNVNIACTPLPYAVGGQVSGLVTNNTVALVSGSDTLSVGNGSYAFPTSIAYNSSYSVSLTAPGYQACAFSPANSNVGIVGAGNVTTVKVVCVSPNYTLGGRVSGLMTNTNVALHNGSDTIAATNGNYTFPTLVVGGSSYNVTITSPAGQSCNFATNVVPNGTMPAGSLKNVDVVCTLQSYTLGGQVSGLMSSTTVELRSGSDDITVGNGAYTFPTAITYKSAYVASLTAPTGQTCVFSPTNSNVGTMGAANATNANVSCSPTGYTIGGTINGLKGTAQVTNGGNTVTLTSNGNFTIPGLVAYQSAYTVALSGQPNNQVCYLANQTGTVGAGNVTNVSIICTSTYALSVHVANLLSGGNVVVVNGNDTVTAYATSANFTFPTRFIGNYNVIVTRQPVGETCAAVSGTGTLLQDTTVTIQCSVSLRLHTNQNATIVPGQADLVSSLAPLQAGQSFDVLLGPGEPDTPAMPVCMAGDSGHLAVVDRNNSRVIIYETSTATGDVVVLLGANNRNTAANAAVLGQDSFATATAACSPSGLNHPRAAILSPDHRVLVADAENNRIMIWLNTPDRHGRPADLVLGQPNFSTCTRPSPNASTAATLSQPWSVWTDGTHVMVADTYAARVLIWNSFPTVNGQDADAVLGQPDFFTSTVDPSSATVAGPAGMIVGGPAGVTSDGASIFVADYSLSRITQWSGVPWAGQTPVLSAALGAPDTVAAAAGCNVHATGPGPAVNTACFPAGITVVGTQLVVADTGNNRYLVYQSD